MKAKTSVHQSGSLSQVGAKVDDQVYKVSWAVLGISACAIGLWAAASLIGGMIASGGPVALAADWFRAVFGS